MFQPIHKYFKKIGNTDHISAWKYRESADESIKPPSTSDNSLALLLSYIGTKTRLKFVRSCLKQDKITFTHKNIVNIYIAYEINLWDCGYDDYTTLENCLIMILISSNIQDMVLDLIDVGLFQ